MLNIYTDKNLIPNDMTLIVDVESYFILYVNKVSRDDELILKAIDKCTIDSNGSIIDRFGYKIYPSDISTGCKSLICAKHSKQDIVISMREFGQISGYALSYVSNGNVYIPHYIKFGQYDVNSEVSVNGIRCESYDEASYLTGMDIHDIDRQRDILS